MRSTRRRGAAAAAAPGSAPGALRAVARRSSCRGRAWGGWTPRQSSLRQDAPSFSRTATQRGASYMKGAPSQAEPSTSSAQRCSTAPQQQQGPTEATMSRRPKLPLQSSDEVLSVIESSIGDEKHVTRGSCSCELRCPDLHKNKHLPYVMNHVLASLVSFLQLSELLRITACTYLPISLLEHQCTSMAKRNML